MSGAKKTRIVPIERLHELFTPEYEEGLLRWKIDRRGTAKAGAVAGWLSYYPKHRKYRRHVEIDDRGYYNSRLIWAMFNDRFPPDGYHIDHIDHDTLNDCIWNLRLATNAENMRNRHGAQRNNHASGYRGVSYHKRTGRWQARITVNSTRISFGYFDTKEEAAVVAEAARREHFGEFAGSALKVAK